MPPKKAIAATSSSSEGTSLTPGETKMLAVVCALMGDVPQVNFETVAKHCGIKYGKNARQSCKRLFEKIKNSHPELNIEGSGAAGAGSGAEDGLEENEGVEAAEEGDAPKRAARSASKDPKAAAAAKKTVGKAVAPKKATAPKKAPAKKGAAGKGAAKAVTKSESDDAGGEEVDEEAVEPMEQDYDGNIPSASIDVSPPPAEAAPAGDLAGDLVFGLGTSADDKSPSHIVAVPQPGDVSTTSEAASEGDQVIAGAPSASVDAPVSACDQLVPEASSASAALSQPDQPLTVSTSVAVNALAYFVSEELFMHIDGYDYPYCNQDIIDAQLHGITLKHFILWKFENNVDRATVCGR
ncbi:hypothetical protein ACEPPN_007282 [Leptodophora sp. 'Broadleaf-Isolate-01']